MWIIQKKKIKEKKWTIVDLSKNNKLFELPDLNNYGFMRRLFGREARRVKYGEEIRFIKIRTDGVLIEKSREKHFRTAMDFTNSGYCR